MNQLIGWQPIKTAPEGVVVLVGYLDADYHEEPEQRCFDCKEDGAWVEHANLYQEFCAVAPPGSTGPSEKAPYTHWMAIPPIPKGV